VTTPYKYLEDCRLNHNDDDDDDDDDDDIADL